MRGPDPFNLYIVQCLENCDQRIPLDFYENDSMQSNALRVETLRDKCVRCGMKPPEHWAQSAKDRGWGLWVYSGGSPSVYAPCDISDCPRKEFFIRTAPIKAWRELAELQEETE